jgi:hypothetical protein
MLVRSSQASTTPVYPLYLQIWDDWSNAAAHNGTYAIHPNQNHTGFPGTDQSI